MGKYRTVTIHYQPNQKPVSDGTLGKYINDLLAAGIKVVQIVNEPDPHTLHDHPTSVPEESPYTAVQGNVGSS